MKPKPWQVLMAVSLLAALLASLAVSVGADPERGISLTTTYTHVVIGPDKEARLTLKVNNTGKEDETVNLQITSAPRDWDARYSDFSFDVKGVFVPAGKPQDVDFRAKPPKEVAEGDYSFALRAISQDGKLESNLKISISIKKEAGTEEKVKLTAQYPVLSGPSGSRFQFSMDISNEGDKERSFDLLVRGPQEQGWNYYVKPAYEEKQISTIRLKGAESRGIDLVVTPPEQAKPDSYTLTLQAVSGTLREALELKLTITGTYKLEFLTYPGTPAMGRLNAEATAGQESVMSLWVTNTGTDQVRDITFSSTKPEGWVTTFEPDKIDSLPPRQFREVNVKFKPTAKTIAGDYAVNLNAVGDKATAISDIRVTVSTSTRWGAVGIGLVVVVVGGLAGLFLRLGRR